MFSSTWVNQLNFSESYLQSTNCSVKLYLYDGRVQGLLVKYTRIRKQNLMTVIIWLQQCTTSRKRSRYASSLVHMRLLLPKLSVLQPATKYQLITNLLTSASLADVQNASLSSVLTRGSYYSNFVVPAGGMPAACEAGLT
jgi:hypothetical protein